MIVGLLIALGALVVYALSNPVHFNQYNHFAWQADAFLNGRAWIPFPQAGTDTTPANDYFQDIYPLFENDEFTGRVLLPFPPLPALVLLPFVAAWGLSIDQESIAIGIAGRRRAGRVVDARRAPDHARRAGGHDARSSPPGRSGGGPRPSAARGTSRTSSR